MHEVPAHPRDPIGLSIAITGTFALLCCIRLALPSQPYFDENYYVPAAREWIDWGTLLNQEHPPLGKQLIALSIFLFGDGPAGWRMFSLLAGSTALFASMRAMWFASQHRFASISFGILLATNFLLFIHARIAMLDIFMAAFLTIAAWQFAAALKEPETARLRLALTGIAFGAAIASKWNAVPLVVLPGIAFFVARLFAGRRRLLVSQRGLPIPGISLLEAALWLGVVPLAVYALTYAPATILSESPFTDGGLIALHASMLDLQTQPLQQHHYQSTWPDWILNLRAVWYLYADADGALRGIMLIGNPLTMLLGLPALLWCLVSGMAQRDWPRLAMVIGYVTGLGLWIFAEKSVQYYYHYLVPSFFLLGALALALDALWRGGHRWLPAGTVLASCALFAWFHPIMSAAPLAGPEALNNWVWLNGWI